MGKTETKHREATAGAYGAEEGVLNPADEAGVGQENFPEEAV